MIEIQAETANTTPAELSFRERYHRPSQLRLWFPLHRPAKLSSFDRLAERLQGIVESTSDLNWASGELASKACDKEDEYYLNPVRTAIVQPLLIAKEHSVLQVGAECGLITRFLAEKAGKVLAVESNVQQAHIAALRTRDLSNVDVVACSLQDFVCEEKFDLVVMVEGFEYSSEYVSVERHFQSVLEKAQSFLSPEGVLVLAIENKLGLKYFSGARLEQSVRVFEGIEGYPSGAALPSFGKVELQKLLQAAGFSHASFLYPFPDHKFPSVIVAPDEVRAASDEPYLYQWLSYRNASDHTAYKLFRERLVARQLEANQLLTHMANSFLILAGQSVDHVEKFIDSQSLIYKYGLGRNSSCMTEVVLKQTEDGPVVVKKRLCPSLDHVQKIANSPLRLILQPEPQVRPFTKGSTLMEEITAAFTQSVPYVDADEILIPLLERWYQFLRNAVLKSSDSDSLLPGIYWDCIPENLILLQDGSLLYFDQEFEFYESLPIKYVLFRGLLHLYQNGLAFISQSYVKEKLSNQSFRSFLEHMLQLVHSQISDSEYDRFWEIEWLCMKSVLLVFKVDLDSFKTLYSSLDPSSIIKSLPWLEEQLAQVTDDLAGHRVLAEEQRILGEEQLKIAQLQLRHAQEEIANSVEAVNFLSSTINNMQQSKFWQLRALVLKLCQGLQL